MAYADDAVKTSKSLKALNCFIGKLSCSAKKMGLQII